jgi:hypothetical protein
MLIATQIAIKATTVATEMTTLGTSRRFPPTSLVDEAEASAGMVTRRAVASWARAFSSNIPS